jgi:hypothetical protein
LPFVDVFIHEKADAPPTGFADRGRPADEALRLSRPSGVSGCCCCCCCCCCGCDLNSPLLVFVMMPVLGRRFASHRLADVDVPFSLAVALDPPPPPAALFRRCSPLDRGGGGGSYEAPVLADTKPPPPPPLDFCDLRTFMVREGRPAG